MQAEAKAVANTVNKHIRIDEELWQCLEEAARELDTTANRLLAELAERWLEKRAWPTTEAEVQIARASLFAAQVLAHDMMAAGRGQEIDEIRRYIATIVPDTVIDRPAATSNGPEQGTDEKDSWKGAYGRSLLPKTGGTAKGLRGVDYNVYGTITKFGFKKSGFNIRCGSGLTSLLLCFREM